MDVQAREETCKCIHHADGDCIDCLSLFCQQYLDRLADWHSSVFYSVFKMVVGNKYGKVFV